VLFSILRALVSIIFFGKKQEIRIQSMRRDFIIDKLIKKTADEDHDEREDELEAMGKQKKKEGDIIYVDDRDNDERMTALIPKKNI
jgi:hypothetical protein